MNLSKIMQALAIGGKCTLPSLMHFISICKIHPVFFSKKNHPVHCQLQRKLDVHLQNSSSVLFKKKFIRCIVSCSVTSACPTLKLQYTIQYEFIRYKGKKSKYLDQQPNLKNDSLVGSCTYWFYPYT